MAELLREFDIAKIPVLWRPFHEADGTWFWWGAKGPETAAKLYEFMFNYFTKVKNLPDEETLLKDGANWLWFMTWSKEFVMTEDYSSHEQIKKLYASDYCITRDQLPNLW